MSQTPSIYFMFPQTDPPRHSYHHAMVVLAEGLAELGVSIHSNIDYWRPGVDEPYLLKHDPNVRPEDCKVVVLDYLWPTIHPKLPGHLLRGTRDHIAVMLDWTDGHETHAFKNEYRAFDLVFRTHCNVFYRYPLNFTPWAYGFGARVRKALGSVTPFEQRQQSMLINFRLVHTMREYAKLNVYPKLEKYFDMDERIDNFEDAVSDTYGALMKEQTCRRHFTHYYERLKKAAACSVFAGYSAVDKQSNMQSIHSWDSWRFWESLAAGCVTIHMDLAKFGAALPIMPTNWLHYIGIDLANIDADIQRIEADPGIFSRIASEGRRWALRNYSPRGMAIQFLRTLSARCGLGADITDPIQIRAAA